MKNIIVITIILIICWCFYTGKININVDKFKESSIEKLKNEKTIKTINSSRDRTQQDVYNVTNP